MKKIFVLTIATILLIFAGISARELIENEPNLIEPLAIPSTVTPTTKTINLSNTFLLYQTDQSINEEITLETIGEYNGETITTDKSQTQWKLYSDKTQLEIKLNNNESVPYGSDIEPEAIMLNSQLSDEPLYRIKVDNSFYFYTNRYFTDSCGQKYCSNGLVDTGGETNSTIFCTTDAGNTVNLNFCDNLVENLRKVE
ncbi:hypothetical protein KC675_02065 [Candidatus Dojkabacteria bacterium]|uniref:Uncharacterized protein n=1 Tax=Candidatus Dojkabacteria bacterium TaxID=2099670 RepID=A0A955I8P4_9BACT|nr:hypothetical protein [Candidatus Dojkabacteria bacterium]